MARIKTHVIITAAIIILMLGVTGCMSNRLNEAEALREKASNYLETQYQDHFRAINYSAKSWAYPYARIIFTSEHFANAEVEVRAYLNEDGSYRFVENYYQLSFYEDALRYLKGKIQEIEPLTIKLRFPSDVWSDELGDASMFAEWLAAGNCEMDAFIITQTELSAKEQVTIVQSLTDDGLHGTVAFITTLERDALKDYPLSAILNDQKNLIETIQKYDLTQN